MSHIDSSAQTLEGAASVAIKLVHIRWIDSSSPSTADWYSPAELTLKALTCETVGILIAEDSNQISVASSITETGALYGVITIPKCSILKRRRIT